MIALASLLVVVIVASLIMRIATIALTATGLPAEIARFQARSAITGVGFTTTESESLVNHPLRRRILMTLMLVGNAGLITVLASLIITFANTGGTGDALVRLSIVIGGLLLTFGLTKSKAVERRMNALIVRLLRRFTDLDLRDYVHLMHLARDYAVTELHVNPGDWVADKPLSSLNLPEEGVLVLGIQRVSGEFVGAPRGQTVIHPHDMLILYGRSSVLSDLDDRRDDYTGDRAHREAVAEHEVIVAHEELSETEENE